MYIWSSETSDPPGGVWAANTESAGTTNRTRIRLLWKHFSIFFKVPVFFSDMKHNSIYSGLWNICCVCCLFPHESGFSWDSSSNSDIIICVVVSPKQLLLRQHKHHCNTTSTRMFHCKEKTKPIKTRQKIRIRLSFLSVFLGNKHRLSASQLNWDEGFSTRRLCYKLTELCLCVSVCVTVCVCVSVCVFVFGW